MKLGRQTEEALLCFERAIEIDPRYAMAWNNKGLALEDLGNSRDAVACFDSAINLNPHCSEAWFNKGLVLGRTGQLKEARYESVAECAIPAVA